MGNSWSSSGTSWNGDFTITSVPNATWTPPVLVGGCSTTRIGTCVGGHSADGEMIRYIDGLYVAYCASCGERWQFAQLPAHDVALRARELFSSMLEDRSRDPETMSRLNEMADDLRRARDDLEAALELLDIVEGLCDGG